MSNIEELKEELYKKDVEVMNKLYKCVIVFGILAVIFSCIMTCEHTIEGKTTYTKTLEKHKLYAIQNSVGYNVNINGAMFAIVGGISGDAYKDEIVYVYQQNERGSIKLVKYNYSNVEFQFTKNNEEPYIETCATCRKDSIYNYAGKSYSEEKYKNDEGDFDNKIKFNGFTYTLVVYIMHIPKNSIINSYDLNIKNLE